MEEKQGEKKTLYASGFPIGIQYREARNVFLFQRGFQHVRLVDSGRVPIVFATFETQEDALACKAIMHGGKLDEDSSVELRLELAKADKGPPPENFRKRGAPGSAPHVGDGVKRSRTDASSTTIYFYGMNPETQESEVKDLVTSLQGFIRHRWSPSKRPGGSPVAYADFHSTDAAQHALDTLNGVALPSVPNGVCVRFADVAPDRRSSRQPPQARPAVGYFPYAPPPDVYGGYAQQGQQQPVPGYPGSSDPGPSGQYAQYGQFHPYGQQF